MPRPVPTEPAFRAAIAILAEGSWTIQQISEALALQALQQERGDFRAALRRLGYTEAEAAHTMRRILGPTEEAA